MCKLLLFINFERGFRGKFNKTVEILSAAFNLVEQHNSVLRWRECKKRHSQTLIDLFVSKFTGLQLRSKLQPALIVSTNILCVVKIRDCYALFAVGSVRDKIYANFAGFNTFLRSSLSRSRTLTGDCLQDKKTGASGRIAYFEFPSSSLSHEIRCFYTKVLFQVAPDFSERELSKMDRKQTSR